MDPIITAIHEQLTLCVADLRSTINGLDTATLNRTLASETNSLAVLITHAATSTHMLIDSALTGTTDRRKYMTEERPAAFATQAVDAAQLLSLVEQLERTINRLVDAPPINYGATITMVDEAEDPSRTRGWSLIRAVTHLREHVGHAQLSRQVFEAGGK